MITRRTFGQYLSSSLLALFALSTATLTGCTFGSAISSLKSWIPVALSSVNAILKLLGPIVPAPVSAAVTLIQAGFAALLAAIESYQAGNGVLQDVTNAITAVENSFASFFQALSVPPVLLNLIEGLAGIILSTIAAFANQIKGTNVVTSYKLAGSRITVTPVKRSRAKFVHDFNALLIANNHSNVVIK